MNKIPILLLMLTAACSGRALFGPGPEAPLLRIDGEPVQADEFIYAFNKNRPADTAVTRKAVDDYLELYINFKLKVAEARARGLDTTAAFRSEFGNYLKQLQDSYLKSPGVTDSLVQEAFARLQEEIRASHILIAVEESAPPADTLAAWQKAMAIHDSLQQGEPFGKMALLYSDDPSVRQNKGDLGYFTVLQMVYPFETAAYTTPVGQISEPVRTRFGYHLIKVTGRRPNPGKVRVAHLMLANGPDARRRIFDLYEQLQGGADWDELCRTYSADARTAANGGELPPIDRRQVPAPFAEAAFALQEPGDISKPVQTRYGWHIIRLIERLPVNDFAANEKQLRARVRNDSRSDLNRKLLLKRLAAENNLQEYSDNIQLVIDPGRHRFVKSKWVFAEDSLAGLPLFSLGDSVYRAEGLYRHIEAVPHQLNTRDFLYRSYRHYRDEALLQYEKQQLPLRYPEYRFLEREYYEGILLFTIMEKEVWQKAATDTAGLQAFYERTRATYIDSGRWLAAIFTASGKSLIDSLATALPGAEAFSRLPEAEKQALMAGINGSTGLSLQLDTGWYEAASHPVLRQMAQPLTAARVETDGQYHYVILLRDPHQPPPLAEVRGSVMAAYQQELEQRWLAALRQKHTVEINRKVLEHVYQQLEKD